MVSVTTTLWSCGEGQEGAWALLNISYNGGSNLQNPIGSGKPDAWHDVDPVSLWVFGCDGAVLEYRDAGGLSGYDITPFDSARLDEATTLGWYGSPPIEADFDLTWTATGKAVPVIEVDPGASVIAAMAAPCTVNGTVTLTGLQQLSIDGAVNQAGWAGVGDSLTFVAHDTTLDARISVAREVVR